VALHPINLQSIRRLRRQRPYIARCDIKLSSRPFFPNWIRSFPMTTHDLWLSDSLRGRIDMCVGVVSLDAPIANDMGYVAGSLIPEGTWITADDSLCASLFGIGENYYCPWSRGIGLCVATPKISKVIEQMRSLNLNSQADVNGFLGSHTHGMPGSFCTSVDETNWYERSLEWHEERSIRLSRL
jgi:hypothetical protein